LNFYAIPDLLSNDMLVALMSILVALLASVYIMPEVIKRMRQAGFVGRDVNKPDHPKVAEMGGVGLVLSVTVALTLVGGALVFFNVLEDATGIYSALAVVFIASYIGLFDDIAVISRKNKAIGLLLAGLPLAVARPGYALIVVPFYGDISLWHYYPLYITFWVIVVPLGVLAAANAFNMAAGYNGMESGQTAIISAFLMLISIVYDCDVLGTMIFAVTFGASIGIYKYNRYPSKTFVGDIGTLCMGALIAVGAIYTGLEFYAVLLIIPMFYEGIATAYYSYKKIERRGACMHPVINDDGTLQPPKGAERFTLAFFLLSKRRMDEKNLVYTIQAIYVVLGVIALSLSVICVLVGWV